VRAALAEGRIAAADAGGARGDAIPVRRAGRIIGAVQRLRPDAAGAGRGSDLESAYRSSADELAAMIADGRFPFPSTFVDTETAPRVGDGIIRLDGQGRVSFASPNARSAFHRLGIGDDLHATALADVVRGLAAGAGRADEALAAVSAGRSPRSAELEASGSHIVLRAIPIIARGARTGALILVRDVTDLRRSERQMATKDATIREVHHRVKNNLQTVAALLRLQARRMPSADGRAALEEAERRVGSIAVVHETLARTPDDVVAFDDIVDRLVAMVVDVAGDADGATVIRARRAGAFGILPAEIATPLAMAVTEVLQNAVEHGLAGRDGELTVAASTASDRLRVEVSDDGRGLPVGFDAHSDGGLGLQIVRTLVEGELAGRLDLQRRRRGGTRVVVEVPLAEG
jgi:two-component sensor histidine kinase